MFSNDICDNFLNGFQVPTINQENGIAGSEANETLKEFRSDKVLRPNKKTTGKGETHVVFIHFFNFTKSK